MTKKLKFYRDGYDYIAKGDGVEYRISNKYFVWMIWVNDELQDQQFNYIENAKEWCQLLDDTKRR